MNITIKEGENGFYRVFTGKKFTGVMKFHEGHLLCYSKGRHTTTQSLRETIRFFNGDYTSCYYRGNER